MVCVSIAGPKRFQSTLPQGERHWYSSGNSHLFQGFNPRSRKGSDPIDLPREGIITVSIHAPARGATRIPVFIPARSLCFNPRSRKGSDAVPIMIYESDCRFQSTLPQGERQIKSFLPVSRKTFQSTLPQGERRLM